MSLSRYIPLPAIGLMMMMILAQLHGPIVALSIHIDQPGESEEEEDRAACR
jgi:hypothetical protein